jgi:hypothetical protein
MPLRLVVIVVSLTLLPAAVAAQSLAPQQTTTRQQPPGNGTASEPAQTEAKPQPWWERITFYGDFRARYEGFFQDDAETRQRERFRLRVGLRTAIADGLDFNLRLASGDAADVTSTNQSLSGFLNRKPINIDQLSLAYTPPDFKPLTLGFGKYGYPVTRTQMVWDDDVNWEGTFERLHLSVDPVEIRIVGVQSPINEIGGDEDAFMFGEYVHAAFALGGHEVQLSLADYAFRNPDQIALALQEGDLIRTQNTNALRRDAQGRVIGYESGFNLVDAIAQVTFGTGRDAYPLVALADVVVNTRAASDEDTGLWLVGAYGTAETPRTYEATYTFARVERDAVVSAYNFSDMGPATNVVMNMATFSYMPLRRVNLDFTAIFTKLLDAGSRPANPTLTRIQVDARVTF